MRELSRGAARFQVELSRLGVDEAKLAELVGASIERAPAAFVRDRTGYAIGGVPPVGHHAAIHTLLDENLVRYTLVWAAAGTPECRVLRPR